MKRLLQSLCLGGLLTAALITHPSIALAEDCPGTPFDSSLDALMGESESLCRHTGEVVLVVNTASQCGFTSQYEGLETLHQRFRTRGFTVIGIPSDQFGGQEYADDEKIADFCRVNFGVSFPMYTRSNVTGADAIPLYQSLINETGHAPQWNFHKYLIGRDGEVLGQWPSRVGPNDPKLIRAINDALDS